MSPKIAFVTPRYGTQVMGGAETGGAHAGRAPARPHRLGVRGAHDLRARPAHLGRRAGAGDHDGQRGARAPAPLHARPAARLLRPRRPAAAGATHGDPGPGNALGRLQRARLDRSWSTPSARRTPTSSPSTPTCTTRPWPPSAGSGRRPCCTRRRTTSPRSTCPSSGAPSATPTRSASTRRRSACWSSGCTRWPSAPRSCSGSAWGSPRARAGPAASCTGLGDRPYIVSVGRVDEHKGSKMLASYFATYKERHPGPLALALVGPVSVELPPHPDIVVTGPVDEADKWDIVHDALVAVSPSALESFSLVVLEAWVDRVPVAGQRRLRADPRALRALGRRAVVHLLPRVRGRPRPPGRPTPSCAPLLGARGRAYVDRHFQWPVLIARYAEFLTVGGGAGAGHARALFWRGADRGRRGAWPQPPPDHGVHPLVDCVARHVVGEVVALAVHASSRSGRSRAARAWRRPPPGRSTTSWSRGAPPKARSA